MIENTPTTIPAMAGLLRCCDDCGGDPAARIEDAVNELGGELVDEATVDEGVIDEVEDELEDRTLGLEFVNGVDDDELVDGAGVMLSEVDSEGVAELVDDVVGVN
jgi:hypothetical protein